jgi:hypothetical protein
MLRRLDASVPIYSKRGSETESSHRKLVLNVFESGRGAQPADGDRIDQMFKK